MARLFTTLDYYTDYTSFGSIDSIISGSVYDPTTTSYNITLRSTPLCFYTTEQFEQNISIKDNSGIFTIEAGSTYYTMMCTSIPVIGQTTELLVHNDDINKIKVVPESVANAMFNVASPDCDGDPTFCVDNTEIDQFCSTMGSVGTGFVDTGTVEYMTYDLLLKQQQLDNHKSNWYNVATITEEQKQDLYNTLGYVFFGFISLILLIFLGLWIKKLLSSFFSK